MRRAFGAVVLAALLGGVGHADEGLATFRVAVTVPVRVTLEMLDQPATLTLTEADVARGYVDLSACYRVRHNDRHGYLLRFAPRVGVAQYIDVRGLDGGVVLRDQPVDVYRAGEPFVQDLALEFRIVLDPRARAGVFELPVEVYATTL